jgi:hypothetical protein
MGRTLARPLRALSAAAALSLSACGGGSAPPQSAEQARPAPSAQPSMQPAPPPPGQPVNADARALEAMLQRVNDYVAVHKKLEETLPKLPKEASPEEIDRHQRALSRLMQEARRGAKPGDIFTSDSQAVVKRLLARVFGGPDGAALRASIMDENPGTVKPAVNGRYPDSVPLSTVPPQVLQGLPKLPDEMEFRFIGNHLILMDVHAHIIVDLIANALPS